MNKVFPRKWYKQHDRSTWGAGPWDAELEDREQWADPATGYPCLMIRTDLGAWSAYVGVYPDHPAFGEEIEDLGHGVNDYGYTDEIRFIEPWPDDPNAVVDVDNPKESILEVVRLPDYLWFFGFDNMHGGDIIPGINEALQHTLSRSGGRRIGTYKDQAHVKKTCAEIALLLWGLTKFNLMDTVLEISRRKHSVC
jgi:hypothetical protein